MEHRMTNLIRNYFSLEYVVNKEYHEKKARDMLKPFILSNLGRDLLQARMRFVYTTIIFIQKIMRD